MEYVIPFAIMLVISVVILILSMIITSSLGGGVDFGEVHIVLAKAIPLLILISLVELAPYGVFIAIPIWWIGLMLLFRLDFWEVRTLVFVNWALNGLAYLALGAILRNISQ
jgi:hypothetical protein